jgi:hypothetical protein
VGKLTQLGENVKILAALSHASGSADRTGTIIDTDRWSGCLFTILFATIAAGAATAITVQQGAVANMSDAAELPGTSVTVADDGDNGVYWVDVQPSERYIRLAINKDATNASAEGAVAMLYAPIHGISVPFTNANGVAVQKPAEA